MLSCNSALMSKEMMATECPIEVVDSQAVSMGLGLIVLVAATAAKAGESLDKVVAAANQAIPKTHLLALFDTLKYLLLGGFASAFLLFGMALVFGFAGTTSLTGIQDALARTSGDSLLLAVGGGLMLVSLLGLWKLYL